MVMSPMLKLPRNLALLSLVLASTSAWAQKPKYTRTQDVKVDVKLSERDRKSVV